MSFYVTGKGVLKAKFQDWRTDRGVLNQGVMSGGLCPVTDIVRVRRLNLAGNIGYAHQRQRQHVQP